MAKQSFIKNPIILIGCVLFIALILSTIYRIILAVNTHPGLVNVDAYKLGQAYAEHLDSAKELEAKGYSLTLTKPAYLAQFTPYDYTAYFAKDKVPIDDALITAYFYRQLEPEYDFLKTFVNNTLTTALSRKGKWLLVVKVEYQDNIMYKFYNLYVN